MRVVLKGIHKVKRLLASGETRLHFYAWRGGPALCAKPGTPEFVREYHEAHASLRQPRAGTLMTIIAQYKAAPEFTRLAPISTVKFPVIREFNREFGEIPRVYPMPGRNRGDYQVLASEFLRKRNRELFRMNREFKYGNREVSSQPAHLRLLYLRATFRR